MVIRLHERDSPFVSNMIVFVELKYRSDLRGSRIVRNHCSSRRWNWRGIESLVAVEGLEPPATAMRLGSLLLARDWIVRMPVSRPSGRP